MGHAHKGRPPRLNWRDLIITYQHNGKTIQEIAKMKGYDTDGPIWWEFKDAIGNVVKITPSGLGMPPNRD